MRDKVLITGGAGFIGVHLAGRLLREGFQVHLVDNLSRGVADSTLKELLAHDNATFSNIDCLDRSAVAALPVDFNYVFHLAAILGVANVSERPYSVVVDNINVLSRVIEHARRQSRLVRLLFASTSEVNAGALENFDLPIPTPATGPLALTDLSRPRTSYMLSKICGEMMCQHSGLPFTIFRPHNVYGPRMGLAHVIPSQLQKAHDASDGDTVSVASVDHTRCFCYVADSVEMLFRMMMQTGCEGETLNLGTQRPEVTIREVASLCHETVGRDVTIVSEVAPPGSPVRRVPDMASTTRLTGFESCVGLQDGVLKTYQWYKANVFEGIEVSAV